MCLGKISNMNFFIFHLPTVPPPHPTYHHQNGTPSKDAVWLKNVESVQMFPNSICRLCVIVQSIFVQQKYFFQELLWVRPCQFCSLLIKGRKRLAHDVHFCHTCQVFATFKCWLLRSLTIYWLKSCCESIFYSIPIDRACEAFFCLGVAFKT